jgi:hypothetical protein
MLMTRTSQILCVLVRRAAFLPAAVLMTVLILAAMPVVLAQSPDDLSPAGNAAKAREIIDDAIKALGGSRYLTARDLDCQGRIGQFDSGSGAAAGSFDAHFLKQFPDRSRTEVSGKNYITNIYSLEINTKGEVVQVYTAENAWSAGKSGVTELGAEAVADYKEQLKTDLNMILRYRLKEDGLMLRYGGTDVVDLKQVYWVEVTDRERRDIRIAIDKNTHLPVRSVFVTRDPDTKERIETARAYSNYRAVGGVQVPFQTALFVNNRLTSQTFYSACQLNTGLSADLFTREGLDPKYSRKK